MADGDSQPNHGDTSQAHVDVSGELTFKEIYNIVKGQPSIGTLKMTSKGIVFKAKSTGKVDGVRMEEITAIRWMRVARGYELRVTIESGYVFLDGFKKSDFQSISELIREHNAQCKISEEEPCVKGWNWGEYKFSGNVLSFMVDHKPAFEVPLGAVVKASVPQKNEALIEFSQDADSKDTQVMESMRFLIVSTGDADDATDAEAFKSKVLEKTEIQAVSGNPICTFTEAHCLTPRGRYDLELYPTFIRMHGKTYQYKIAFSSIIRLFSLPHPQQPTQSFFVINLDPPIRQGMTRYPFLVFQVAEEDKTTLNLNLDNLPKDDKRLDAFPGGEITGSTAEALGHALKALSGRKVTVPNQLDFSSIKNKTAVRCTNGAFDGFLYPLNRAFLFVHKPTIHIRFDEITGVRFERANFGGQAASQSFDLLIETKENANYEFKSVPREDYDSLFQFVQKKKLRINNLAGLVQGPADDGEAFTLSDDEGDPYLSRMKAEGGGGLDMKSESEDEDFKPGEESENSLEFDSDAGDSEDGSGSGGDDDEEKPKKKKKEKKADDEDGEEKPKKEKKKEKKPKKEEDDEEEEDDDDDDDDDDEEEGGKKKSKVKKDKDGDGEKKKKKKAKKDANAPKRPVPAYMLWLAENRTALKSENPTLTNKDLMRVAGVKWKELSEEKKAPFMEKAKLSQQEFVEKNAAYKASKPAAEESESGSDDDGKKKKAKRKRDPNQPRKPMTAFLLWLNASRAKIKEENPEMKGNEISVKAGEMWKVIDPEEKKKWEEESKKLKAKYDEDMAAYSASHPEGSKADDDDDDKEDKTSKKKKVSAPKEKKDKTSKPKGQQTLKFKSDEIIHSSDDED